MYHSLPLIPQEGERDREKNTETECKQASKKESWFVAFADFYGVNTPTVDSSKQRKL